MMTVGSYQKRRSIGVGFLLAALFVVGAGVSLCEKANGGPLSVADFPAMAAGEAPESPVAPIPTEGDGSESEREAESPATVAADVRAPENRHFIPRSGCAATGHLRGLFRPPKLRAHS